MKRPLSWKRVFPLACALLAGTAIGIAATLFFRSGASSGGAESSGEPDAPSGSTADSADSGAHDHTTGSDETWTCAMHPQIHMPKPGKCPICAMDLIPLSEAGDIGEGRSFTMTETAKSLAAISTSPVTRDLPEREVRFYGSIEHDETRMRSISARFPARIDVLHVDYEGMPVKKGDPLAVLYSPDLLRVQSELFTAIKFNNTDGVKGVREKLRLWGFSAEQIAAIEASGKPSDQLPVNSPVSGIVTRRSVVSGDYVETGDPLFMVTDHSVVWLVLEAYEPDLPWLREGQSLTFTTSSHGDREFTGEIAFIDHEIDGKTRTARIRASVDNPGMVLRPGMHVRGTVSGELDSGPALLVPASAVLHTGRRSIVYVEDPEAEEPSYEGREILLGPRAGDAYVVDAGLREGERVVSAGAFAIDSALQIQARPSMMLPPEEETPLFRKMEVPGDFQTRSDAVLRNYFAIQKALAADDLEAAKKAAAALGSTAGEVPHLSLDERASEAWLDIRDRLGRQSRAVAGAADLEAARAAFLPLSRSADELVRRFGTADIAVFSAHCPMANEQQGADWLQTSNELHNPYMGTAMLTCGEINGQLAGAQEQTPGTPSPGSAADEEEQEQVIPYE